MDRVGGLTDSPKIRENQDILKLAIDRFSRSRSDYGASSIFSFLSFKLFLELTLAGDYVSLKFGAKYHYAMKVIGIL